jgi:hypothetical protein
VNRALPWVVGAVLVVGASAVTALTPSDDSLVGPFEVTGAAGERVISRTLIATVSEAIFAEQITVPRSEWQSDGNWLVVRLSVSATVSEVGAAIQLATFTIDGQTFHSSERPSTSLENTALRVGTDTSGILAFELPPDVTADTGELRLATSYATPELDDVIAISLDLHDLPRATSVEITAPELQGLP